MIWKKHPLYNYEASEDGEIRHAVSKRKIKPRICRYGYGRMNLYYGGKHTTVPVHRIVAEAFMGVSELTVNHIDGNKQNNAITNLEFCTSAENVGHSFRVGLRPKNTKPVTVQGIEYYSKREAERVTGLSRHSL